MIIPNQPTDNGSNASPATSPAPLAKERLPRGTNPPDRFLTAADLRARWRVSGMFLWRMRNKGTLNAYKIGARGVRFSLADIERIERQSMTTKGAN